ncbi:MAG: Diguanylate cyclase/phosphodiesterase with sensor(S) [Actinomycetia bacterium]|nr:Diguanylate cyclase/phosphodiesterase with sensor(S) [Actinomycetes bacterium]
MGHDPGYQGSLPEIVIARIARVSRDGIAVLRSERIEWVNQSLATLLQLEPSTFVGRRLADLGLRDLEGEAKADLDGLCRGNGGTTTVTVPREGAPSLALSVDAVRLDAKSTDRWVLTFRSVSRQLRADEDLRASEEQFRALAANAPIGVFQSEHGVRLGYLNDRFAEVWGDDVEALHGTGWLDHIHEHDRAEVITALTRTLEGEEVTKTFRVERRNREVRLVQSRVVPVVRGDRSIGFVGSVEDVTDARRHETELAFQAHHDPLTGLANRAALLAEVNRHLASGRAHIAVLFFDLDDFKVINDSLGHGAGDTLLREVGARMSRIVRDTDLVARFGGDEFVVLCHGMTTDAEAEEMAQRLLDAIDEPMDLGVRVVRLSASVGVVLAKDGTADSLLRDADVAMYQAKHGGKARVAVFDERARLRVQQRLDIVTGVRQALAAGDVPVAYQPLVRTSDRRIVGAEALLRYRHPGHGPVAALETVGLAETSGFINELGENVMRSACRTLAGWRRDRRTSPDYVAVNLAAAQLAADALVPRIDDLLAEFALAPSDLCIELTESQLMADAAQASRVLGVLHERGVRIAIDDFGTGYSSLAYLRRFPADVVKLDRSFIADVVTDDATAASVEAVVTLDGTLGLTVAAEGVETAEQLRRVTELGCDLVQGYATGRPTGAGSFPEEAPWP